MIRYKRIIQVEAYRLSIHNIDEMEAWTKWTRKQDNNFESSQYLQNGEKVCKLGDWIIKDEYTNKVDFYIMTNEEFINKHTVI